MPTLSDSPSVIDETSTRSNVAAADFAAPTKSTRMLLRLLRAAQPISRVELARRLGVNRSTVTETFKPLIAQGVVLEESVPTASTAGRALGRPSLSLSFNATRDFFIGVHIGVRGSQVGLTTLSGETLAVDEFDTPESPDVALELIRSSIEKICAQVETRRLRAIGVSVPGPTDAGRSSLLYAPHLKWHKVSIAGALRFDSKGKMSAGGCDHVPVVVENDSTAAAVYEARLRLRATSGEMLNNFVLVRSGTGIGAGMVLGSEAYRGTGKGEGIAGDIWPHDDSRGRKALRMRESGLLGAVRFRLISHISLHGRPRAAGRLERPALCRDSGARRSR